MAEPTVRIKAVAGDEFKAPRAWFFYNQTYSVRCAHLGICLPSFPARSEALPCFPSSPSAWTQTPPLGVWTAPGWGSPPIPRASLHHPVYTLPCGCWSPWHLCPDSGLQLATPHPQGGAQTSGVSRLGLCLLPLTSGFWQAWTLRLLE